MIADFAKLSSPSYSPRNHHLNRPIFVLGPLAASHLKYRFPSPSVWSYSRLGCSRNHWRSRAEYAFSSRRALTLSMYQQGALEIAVMQWSPAPLVTSSWLRASKPQLICQDDATQNAALAGGGVLLHGALHIVRSLRPSCAPFRPRSHLLYPRWPRWRALCLPRPPLDAPDRVSVRED